MAIKSVSSEVAQIVGNLPVTTDAYGDRCIYKASLVGRLASYFAAEEQDFNRSRFVNRCYRRTGRVTASGWLRLLKAAENLLDGGNAVEEGELQDWRGFGQPMN